MRGFILLLLFLAAATVVWLGLPVLQALGKSWVENQVAGCQEIPLPEDLPGNRLSLSVRSAPTARIDAPPAGWIEEHRAAIQGLAAQSGDVLVYVHGLNNSAADALCAGQALWSALPRDPAGPAPGLIVFDWPSEFGGDFGAAQDMAQASAPYLTALLEALPPERTYLAAHSLGAQVALDGGRAIAGPPRKGLLLIQGAVPAAALLTYSGTRKSRMPDVFEPLQLNRCSLNGAEVTPIDGRAIYSGAIRRFERLVITQTNRDKVLRGLFATDEYLWPRRYGVPRLLPELRLGAREQPQMRPLGAIWTVPFKHSHDSDVLPVAEEWRQRQDPYRYGADRYWKPPEIPKMTLDFAICEDVTFRLEHPDARFVPVANYRRGLAPVIWHSPHLDPSMRAAMIAALTQDGAQN